MVTKALELAQWGSDLTVDESSRIAVYDGTINANTVIAEITGNSDTASALEIARTLTIGSTGKSFDGSSDVSWSLGDIGVNDSTLTLATSGIATGSQTWTSNQGSNATFTVNVPGTNLAMGGSGNSRTITSSTGNNVSVPVANTSNAGFMATGDKSKLDGIEAGAQVNVGTNLGITAGTTAGPIVTSSTGTNATLPTATASNSGVITTGAQTFAGTKTFNNTISGSISGNAGTATTLQTARTINGTSFNGSSNITTANWGTARTLTIGSTGKSVNGSSDVSWSLGDIGVGTLGEQNSNSVSVTGGNIDGTVIGGSTAAAGSFTTLAASTIHISKSEITAYNGFATDGQLSAGATLFVQQTGGNNNALSQIVFQPRSGFPYNRIANSGGSAPFMSFTTNNEERLRITSTGNVGIGTSSPNALLDVDADALIHGLRVGRGAGDYITNIAVGLTALRDNTTGEQAVALGHRALLNNTTGTRNTAIGFDALRQNTTGNDNVAVGRNALLNNTTGNNNNALGRNTLLNNTEGSNNVAIGLNSFQNNTTGSNNTIVGVSAGQNLTTGDNNTIIGRISGTAGLSDTVIIGAGTTERLRITSTGNVGIGTTSPSRLLTVKGIIGVDSDNNQAHSITFSGTGGGGGNFAIGKRVANENSALSIVYGAGSGNSNGILLAQDGSVGISQIPPANVPFSVAAGGSERLRITSAGNVGIGTTSPGAGIDVVRVASEGGLRLSNTEANNTLKLGRIAGRPFNNTDGDFLAFDLQGNSSGNTIIYGGGSSLFKAVSTHRFFTSADPTEVAGTERMRITSTGNVGIGTSSPTSALTVQGTITGTAVTQSSIDTTAGRLLKVGDFGLGLGSGQPPHVPDIDDLLPVGFYHTNNNTAGTFPANMSNRKFGTLLVEVYRLAGNQYVKQTLTANGDQDRGSFWRLYDGSSEQWLSWRRLIAAGEFGVGGTVAPLQDTAAVDDPDRPSGFYDLNASSDRLGPLGATGLWTIAHTRRSSVSAAQLVVRTSTQAEGGTLFSRSFTSGDWTPWRRFYDNRSLLGGVSQESGVPTGAVIQRGSNSNGEFVRFADGTQICQHSLTSDGSADTSWTFPANFVSVTPTSAFFSPAASTGVVRIAVLRSMAVSSANFRVYDAAGNTQATSTRLMAVGRWF